MQKMDMNFDKSFELQKIVFEFEEDAESKVTIPCVKRANPTIAIVWFGDLNQYWNSKTKIVTIGLNPSDKEFVVDRFINPPDTFDLYIPRDEFYEYNNYFRYNPYKEWFNAYERVLNCSNWDATYGGKVSRNPHAQNYAIHIDFYSALATNPTWSKLDEVTKSKLQRTGLFDKLFEFLNPDIALFSTAEKEICQHFDLEQVDYRNKNLPTNIQQYIREYRHNGKYSNTLFLWGKPNIKPFQGVRTDLLQTYFQFR